MTMFAGLELDLTVVVEATGEPTSEWIARWRGHDWQRQATCRAQWPGCDRLRRGLVRSLVGYTMGMPLLRGRA